MNIVWIPTAVLLFFTVFCGLRALISPVSKNLRRFAAIPIAFLICFILQANGLFAVRGLAKIAGFTDMLEQLTVISPYLDGLVEGAATVLISVILFPVVFFLVYWVIRLALKPLTDRFLMAILDRKSENGVIRTVRRSGSFLLGAVGGLLISAVVLLPVFYILPFGTDLVSASRVPMEEEVAYYSELREVDEKIVTPLENAAAVKVYQALGLSSLMQRTAEAGGHVTVNGSELDVNRTMHTLLTHVPQFYFHFLATEEPDVPLAESLTALEKDDFILDTFADLVAYEIATYESGEDGFILKTDTEKDDVMLFDIVDHYSRATHEEIKADLTSIVVACEILAEENYFNELMQKMSGFATESENTLTDFCMENLPMLGHLMDALHAADPQDHIISLLFDALLKNEDVSQYVSEGDILELKNRVARGETTYEEYAAFLQGMLSIIDEGSAEGKLPDDWAEQLPDNWTEQLPENWTEQLPEDWQDQLPEDWVEQLPEDFIENLPEDFIESLPEDFVEQLPDDFIEQLPPNLLDKLPEGWQDRLPGGSSEETPGETGEQQPGGSGEQQPDGSGEQLPEDWQDQLPEDWQDQLPDNWQDQLPDGWQDQLPEGWQDQLSGGIPTV